jgi:hypothetical protein
VALDSFFGYLDADMRDVTTVAQVVAAEAAEVFVAAAVPGD